MKKKYRIGLVGFAHMHVLDQIKPFLAMPERVEWIGAADVKPMVESEYFESSSRSMNLKLCQEQCGFTDVFEDYQQLLELKPDLVLVNCENAWNRYSGNPDAGHPCNCGEAAGLFYRARYGHRAGLPNR